MQRFCTIAISLALSACVAVRSSLVYMPADVLTTMRGGCPGNYKARLFEQDGIALDFLVNPQIAPFRGTLREDGVALNFPVTPETSRFRGTLWLDIPQGGTAGFLDPRLTIASPSYSKSQSVELGGPSCQAPIALRGPRRKECDFDVPILAEQQLLVTVPPVEINGARYDIRPIRFSLQEMPIVCWLSV
jgi:hypothetical protein